MLYEVITGGTFTLLPRRQQAAYLEAVAPFVRSGRVEGVRISTCPDAVSEGCAEWLAGQGVITSYSIHYTKLYEW